jgi:hypothetical protein
LAIDLRCTRIFETTLFYMGELYLSMQMVSEAAYYLDQARLCCSITGNNEVMMKCLVSLAKCAKHV